MTVTPTSTIPATPRDALIPAIIPAAHRAPPTAAGTGGLLRRQPLPLPEPGPSGPRTAQLVYALTAVDKSGRLAARAVIAALGWLPGTRVQIGERAGLVTVAAAHGGGRMLDGRGHLVLPLPVRRRCRLAAGDRLLVVADPDTATLTGYPLAVLDRLLTAATDDPPGART